jgi:hypothetical protein
MATTDPIVKSGDEATVTGEVKGTQAYSVPDKRDWTMIAERALWVALVPAITALLAYFPTVDFGPVADQIIAAACTALGAAFRIWVSNTQVIHIPTTK